MGIVYPPNEVFHLHPNRSFEEKKRQKGEVEGTNWYKTVCRLSGGMYSYYENEPYPRKGHVYPEAVSVNNIVKRLFVGLMMITFIILNPLNWFKPIKLLENILTHLTRLADSIYQSIEKVPYLQKIWYKNCGRELWDFLYFFLKGIGINAEVSYNTGKMLATSIEYDDAYQYRIEDIFTETSKEALVKNPRKEVKRLKQIYLKRERLNNSVVGVNTKFRMIFNLLSLALLIPKINKAFKFAISELKFSNLQLDDESRYYCLNRRDYDFFGAPVETRLKQYYYLKEKYYLFKKQGLTNN